MKYLNLKIYSSKIISTIFAASMLINGIDAIIPEQNYIENEYASIIPISEKVPYEDELNPPNYSKKGQSKFNFGVPIAPTERADRSTSTGKNVTPGHKNPNQVNFDSGACFYMLTQDGNYSSRRGKFIRSMIQENLYNAQKEHDYAIKTLETQELTPEERTAKITEIDAQFAKAQKNYDKDIKALEEVHLAEKNNIELYKFLASHPNDEMAKLPCEVIYNALELSSQKRTGTTRIFNNPKCRDNLSVAMKMMGDLKARGIDNPKVAVLDAASEVTVGGAPAITGMSAEESMERRTPLYAWLTGGEMDNYYIQYDAKDTHGFHYNPNKCALAKGIPVYPVDEQGNLQPITQEQIPTLDTVDVLVHASRNINSTCCDQMPCILPEIDLSDLLTSSESSKIDATHTKKVFDRNSKKEIEVKVPIFGTITANQKLTNVATTSGIDDIATHLAEKIAPLTKETTPDEIAQKLKNRWNNAFRAEIQESANQMIKLAVSRGYDAIVINNLGGGVFFNGVSAWADAWANAIRDFGGNLHVAFAIFDDELGKVKNVELNKVHPAEPEANKHLQISEVYANALRAQGVKVDMN